MIKIIRLLQVVSYLAVTSQLLFYLIILIDGLKVIPIEHFLEQRKVIDQLMIGRFKFMYYACLALSLLMVILTAKDPESLLFITTAIALVCLLVDVVVATKGNGPINALVNTYAGEGPYAGWEVVRTQWLGYIQYRGVAITIGMLSLLAGLVIGE